MSIRTILILAILLLTPACAGDAAPREYDTIGETTDDNPRPFEAARNANQDLDIALASAMVNRKNVLLVFGGNWCHDSRGLAAKFEAPELAKLLEESYILTWIDIGYRDRNLDVLRRVGVKKIYGTPIVVILSPDGKIINDDSVHEWRTADSRSMTDAYEYFAKFSGADNRSVKNDFDESDTDEAASEL